MEQVIITRWRLPMLKMARAVKSTDVLLSAVSHTCSSLDSLLAATAHEGGLMKVGEC